MLFRGLKGVPVGLHRATTRARSQSITMLPTSTSGPCASIRPPIPEPGSIGMLAAGAALSGMRFGSTKKRITTASSGREK